MAELSKEKIMSFIPSVEEYQRELESLNNQLGKTTLTGKISSLDVAETLFIYMEETQERFSVLQQSLLSSLVDESIERIASEISDYLSLINNLFETILKSRERDAVLLAKDLDIKEYLKDFSNLDIKSKVEKELDDFILTHSFYKNVFVFNKQGSILISRSGKGKGSIENCPFIDRVLDSEENEGVAFLGSTALDPKASESILYGAQVRDENGDLLGGVILNFDLTNEMETISPYFENAKPVGALLSSSCSVIASTNTSSVTIASQLKKSDSVDIIKYRGVEYLSATKDINLNGLGVELCAAVVVPLNSAFKKGEEFMKLDEDVLENSQIVSEELKSTREQSEEINEDLIDVVINGEIIASKKRAYALNPILENIRIISERINVSFSTSIADIHDTVVRSKLDTVELKALNVLRILSRVLYMQINDSKQFATVDEIRNAMSKKDKTEEDRRSIVSALETIGELNRNYYNIYAFDTTGTILGVSNPSESSLTGKGVESDVVKRALSIKKDIGFSMSELVPSSFYSDKETYVVSVPVENENDHVVGGIATILDYGTVIDTLLKRTLQVEEEENIAGGAYAAIVTREGVIVSVVGDTEQKIGDVIEVPASYYAHASTKGESKLEKIDKNYYAMGSASLDSYRSFDIEEHKKNDIVVVTVSKI